MKIHAYKIGAEKGSQALEDVIKLIHSTPLEERYAVVGGIEMRVDDVAQLANGCWLLDIARLNFGVGPGKGHRSKPTTGFVMGKENAFADEGTALYCPRTNAFLVEYKHSGARIGSIIEYLSRFNDTVANVYFHKVILDADAQARLKRKDTVRKFELDIQPSALSRADREAGIRLGLSLGQGETFGGEIITIGVRLSRETKTGLAMEKINGLTEWVGRVWSKVQAGETEKAISKAKIVGARNDEAQEVIDLLVPRLEIQIKDAHPGGDRRIPQSQRFNAMERAYLKWSGIL